MTSSALVVVPAAATSRHVAVVLTFCLANFFAIIPRSFSATVAIADVFTIILTGIADVTLVFANRLGAAILTVASVGRDK